VAILRESDYRGRRMRPDEVVLERFAMSPAGTWYLMHIAPRFDRAVIPRTKGRISSMGLDKIGLVTTTGAKSGKPRTGPLALIRDGESLLAIGSNYGGKSHPAWSHNLLAHPDCEVEYRGPRRPYHAELLEGQERARAWARATDFYAGYDRYRERCAPREIRVFRLTPRDA
jgi:deazaflavin-dependent oxidoreductase (nitroreductase family)